MSRGLMEVTCPSCGEKRMAQKKNKYASSMVLCKDCRINQAKKYFKLSGWDGDSYRKTNSV